MRVSERMRYDIVQDRVEDAKSTNARALDKLSSQNEVANLSDNPIAATQVIRFRDKIGNLTQYQKNITFSQGFLDQSEKCLEGITDNLIRAKELSIAMSNDSYDASSREATSREIREIIDEVVQLANASYNGRYVFAGFRNQTPPVTLDGTYLGDDGAIYLQISRDNFRQINLQARHLFEASPEEKAEGHFNMIHTIEILHEGLVENNKDMIRKAMTELEFQLSKTTSHQATLGGLWKSLNNSFERLNSEEVQSRALLSKVQDADIYEATSEFKRAEVVLQSTLQASTKLLQPSLLNFLQ